jgi:hypothetical protein
MVETAVQAIRRRELDDLVVIHALSRSEPIEKRWASDRRLSFLIHRDFHTSFKLSRASDLVFGPAANDRSRFSVEATIAWAAESRS